MKKIVSCTLAALMACSALAGCSGGTDSGSQPQSTGSEKKEYAQSITLMSGQNYIKDIDRELFEKFKEETGIEVKVLLTPDGEYESMVTSNLAGGSDVVDVFLYGAGNVMVSAGIPEIALDLSNEEWVSRYEDWALEANTYDGKVYGCSTWGVDYEGIIYNKTFFEENNLSVPETWDEFVKLCDDIKALGVTPLYESINGTWHTQGWFYGMTPSILEAKPDAVEYLNAGKDNKWADIPVVAEGLTQIRDFLGAKENGVPKYYTNDGQAEDFFGSYPSLLNRETVMMFTYSAYPAELAAQGGTDEWGMFPCPVLDNKVGVSNGGGVSKFINKNSSKIEESKLLFEFLTRDENLEAYYGARSDLVTSAFKDVESVASTTATKEMLERSERTPEVMMLKSVLYWDPDIYKYMQGFAAGETSVEQMIQGMDDFRATMFDAAG